MKHVDSNVQKTTSVNVNLRLFIISFLLFVIQILLILAGIEVNPGPSDDMDSSQSSINSTDMSDFGELFSKSVSILHFNVQRLAPKIDLIQAEYSDFDILAFSETWLNNNHTDESIKILNYQHPFRLDRGPHKSNIDDSSAMLPEELHNISDDISYIELTVTEVEDILKIVNPTKASGPDLINPKLLKEASSVLKYPLCELFNLSLNIFKQVTNMHSVNINKIEKNP
ncbi:unnamed protein product [Mytilus coruscus]|uniref:Endonuclease/exonuclease/phosphatase domain-containing protein n=1 Tax=Mytilus coruscus TaxID=42192 RepID=A0A6J8BX38_MYTCO|nr:unnamed protein product [Mytilus coruscus]